MSYGFYDPPMSPANPLLRVDLLLTHDEGGFHVTDNSNVPLEVNWEWVITDFVQKDQTRSLPPGEYVFIVRHGEGFRVAELPTVGLSEQTRKSLIDYFQPFCEETFRALCVGLVSFPTPREIRLAARSIVNASVKMVIQSLQDPEKLADDFLTFIPTATDRLGLSWRIEHNGVGVLLTQDGCSSLPGGMVAMPGVLDDVGRLEVKVGYQSWGALGDWLNAALAVCLTEAAKEVYVQVLHDVIAQFEDKRRWYEKVGAHLKKLVSL